MIPRYRPGRRYVDRPAPPAECNKCHAAGPDSERGRFWICPACDAANDARNACCSKQHETRCTCGARALSCPDHGEKCLGTYAHGLVAS